MGTKGLVTLMMSIFDDVFVIVFARFRRQLGEQQIDEAWRRANLRFFGYIFWALSSFLTIFEIAIFSLIKIVSPDVEKKVVVISVVIIGLLASQAFSKRFKKYLSTLPRLSSSELPSETKYVRLFQAISVGIFLFLCVVAYSLHEIFHAQRQL